MPKTETAPAAMLVRIHPPAPNHGYYAHTYLLTGSGYPKFDYRKGWYEVDYATSLRLMKIRNNPQDPYSRPVFQVCTKTEAAAIEEAEKFVVAEANDPIPMPKKVAKKVHQVEKQEVPDTDVEDEDLDLRDEIDESEWAEAEGSTDDGGYMETADEDDLAEIEALTKEAAPVLNKTRAKPKAAKKKATKKKAAKKPRRRAKKTAAAGD